MTKIATTGMRSPLGEVDALQSLSVNTVAFADVSDDDEEEVVAKPKKRQPKRAVLKKKRKVIDDDDDDDEDDDDSDGSTDNGRYRPPRPSTAAVRQSMSVAGGAGGKRRRRRSSARFLRLNRSRDSLDSVSTTSTSTNSEHNLSELYQKAIRMNAENKINAGNSWNLRLIENIDKFLDIMEEEDEDAEEQEEQTGEALTTPRETTAQGNTTTTTARKRVNFTKASCTLDASVKIYSYRVDDVHLTSYKVLANLNRTDNNKENKKKQDEDDGGDLAEGGADDRGEETRKTSRQASKQAGNTLETNIGNINLNKLDSAFDIDPLFHKMSKTFDEGGAKGLLLHNLGVSQTGCNIVFDSSDTSGEDGETLYDKRGTGVAEQEREEEASEPEPRVPEGMMNISNLNSNLLHFFETQPNDPFTLVPQLAGLRAEYSELQAEGFTDDGIVTPSSRRRRRPFCEPDPEEEREAEKSIHKEALERSIRFSMTPGKNRFNFVREDNELEFGDDGDDDGGQLLDFVGGFDDGGDDDDFETFIVNNDAGSRYSSFSFQGSIPADSNANMATANLLDALSAGNMLLAPSVSSADYFDMDVFKDSRNVWAGAAHWKRSATATKKMRKTSGKTPSKSAKKTKSTSNKQSLVPLNVETPDLSALLEKQVTDTSKKSRRKNSNSVQLSKAMITKHTSNENILPADAGIQVEHLSQLFLRPNAIIKANATKNSSNEAYICKNGKSVGFQLPLMDCGSANDWDNGSYGGGDDDGPGFVFADNEDAHDMFESVPGNNEFVVQELADVRKVEKIQIGYATVDKKVDVKRLKKDLWTELELKIARRKNVSENKEEQDGNEGKDNIEEDLDDSNTNSTSFKDVVKELETQQSQVDVTLPFYFICVLHLANEKCLKLTSNGLQDLIIEQDTPISGGTSF